MNAELARQLRDRELCDQINNILSRWLGAVQNAAGFGKSFVHLVGHDLIEENIPLIHQAMSYLNKLGYKTILDVDGFGVISLEIRW